MESNLLQRMIDELAGADAIYQPSNFWKGVNQINLAFLQESGLANFKRTINQNYFNWLLTDLSANQTRALINFWAAHPHILPWRTRIEDPTLLRMFTGPENLLANADARDSYCLFVGLLWYFMLMTDHRGISRGLTEPALGNPIVTTLEGRPISQDLANSVREANVVLDHLQPPEIGQQRPAIAELGAGYGRVGYVFLATQPYRYMIFDIPPALGVAQWYLTTLFPQKRAFGFRHFEKFSEIESELAASNMAFFTPNQLAMFPDEYFEAFISISSLQEMTSAQIQNYKNLMGRVTHNAIYLKQCIAFKNAHDGIEVRKGAYLMDGPWGAVLDRTDLIHDQFFEMVWRRGFRSI